jgi:hypothetical protein
MVQSVIMAWAATAMVVGVMGDGWGWGKDNTPLDVDGGGSGRWRHQMSRSGGEGSQQYGEGDFFLDLEYLVTIKQASFIS